MRKFMVKDLDTIYNVVEVKDEYGRVKNINKITILSVFCDEDNNVYYLEDKNEHRYEISKATYEMLMGDFGKNGEEA